MYKTFILTFLLIWHVNLYAQVRIEHDTSMGLENSVLQIDSDTYLVAYRGNSDDGFIKTFTVPADGSSITQVTSLEHDTNYGYYNSLVHVTGNIYALAYTGNGNDGFIKTFNIPTDGSSITQIASLEHDTDRGEHNSLVQVDSDTYVLAYAGNGYDGFIKTFTISSDGTSITQVSSLEHDTVNGRSNSLVKVDTDTYALAYKGQGDDGFIKTFTVPADGSSITQVASREHNTNYADYNSFIQVDSDTYLLAYGNVGEVVTFTIPADGSSITEVTSLQHNSGNNAIGNSLVKVDSDTYALVYQSPSDDSDGYVKTFTVAADGSSITQVAVSEFNLEYYLGGQIVQVDSDTYLTAYAGGDNDGFIETFTINSSGAISDIAAMTELSSTIQFSSSTLDVSEADGTITITVETNVAAYAINKTVDYTVSGSSTATGSGSDYTLSNGTATISAGNTSTTFNISIVNDTSYECIDETIVIDLSNVTGNNTSLGSNTTLTISIADDDPETTVTNTGTMVLEHDGLMGLENSIIELAQNNSCDNSTYLVAHRGNSEDGFIKTFTISSDGSTITQIASLEHDTNYGYYNSLVHVTGNIYALAYTGNGNDGFIKTFNIPTDGSSITQIASLEHDTDRGEHNSLVQVDSDTYVLAYAGNGYDGFIKTFTISSDGTSITQVSSLEHDTVNGRSNSLVKVDTDTYALAYKGQGDDGFIKTFTVPADGSSITQVASREHNTNYADYNSFIQVDSDTYLLAYGNVGEVVTFTIPADGSSITEVTSLQHNSGNNAIGNSLVKVDSDTYALVYQSPSDDSDGYVKTFTVAADGSSITQVAVSEFDPYYYLGGKIIQLDADSYAIAYAGDGNDGYIATIGITSSGLISSPLWITGNAGFRMLSSPVSGQVLGNLLTNAWTQGMTGADVTNGNANVWTFSVSGQSWTTLSDISGSGTSVAAGQGFLTYVFADNNNDGTDDLPITLSVSGSENSGSATYPGSGSIAADAYGLAGNPYYSTIDWDDVTKTNVTSTAYVWDNATGAYKSWNGSSGGLTDGLIAPFQGFWVQANGSGSGSITIEAADKSSSAGTFYGIADMEESGSLSLTITSKYDKQDVAWFSFTEDGEVQKDNKDAYKLLPLTVTSRIAAMSYSNESSLDINNLPFSHDQAFEVPLDVMSLEVKESNFITIENDITISWDIDNLPTHIEVIMIDQVTGTQVNIRDQYSYTFTTEPKGSFSTSYSGPVGTYPVVGEARFSLLVSYDALTSGGNIKVLPAEFALHAAFPNPFNPSTQIQYALPEATQVTLEVFNSVGQKVMELVNGQKTAGLHTATFDASGLSSGVYLYKITTPSFTETKKMLLIK